ncbi:MAG: glycosyltransferase [Synergistaceae bacterium]|nr:glycosyltransferase [Synergistaceae bacterium]
MQSIAVLIPCYNEAKTIKKVVEDWKRELPEAKIYVYDNNSTDGTAKIAEDAGAVVRYERLQGKGNVVRRMFQEIEADCYIMADGDDQHPAEEGCGMAELVLNNGVDMVIGDRLSSSYFQENQRRFHNFGNNLVRYLINKIFNANVKDIMTGYRALSYRFVKSFPVVSQGFEIEAEMTIHAVDKNMSFVNKTVPFRNRPEGSVSSMNTIVDGIKVIKTILHLFCDYRPFVFFSLIAACLSILSLIFFIPVLNEYFQTGLVPRFPTLIICGFAMIAAINLFIAGIILQTIKHKERREFEFRLQVISQWQKIKK